MFFQGSIWDGISLAIAESKAVVCFVRDETPTSSMWEDEFYTDDEFVRLLQDKAVTLRIRTGSQEARLLASFVPISSPPAVIVIRDGRLQDYIVAGLMSKDGFRGRLTYALNAMPPATVDTRSQQQQQQQQGALDTSTARASSSNSTSTTPTSPASSQRTQPASDVARKVGEARASGSKEHGKQQLDNAQASSDSSAIPEPNSTPQKQKQPNETRKRSISNLKHENGKHSTKGLQISPASSAADKPASNNNSKAQETQFKQTVAVPSPTKQCRLQIRLFDGRSVRSSFSPSQTIRDDVRPWLNGQLPDGSSPYNLKHILTPLPSRTISVTEEDKSLQDLELSPTANLVMVPIQSYTEAYAASAPSLPVRGAYAVYGLLSSVVSGVTGLVGSLLSYGQSSLTQSQAEDRIPVPGADTDSSSRSGNGMRRGAPQGSNVRTLGDQLDGRDDNQFYNGNQLNFEPRTD